MEKQAANSAPLDDTIVSLNQIVFPLAPNAPEADRQRVSAQSENATKGARSCGEFLQIGREQAPQTSGDLGKVRVGDLPAELRATVLGLKVAEPSHPVAVRGGVGILMVCEREASPFALPSHDEMADMLMRDRLENLARR